MVEIIRLRGDPHKQAQTLLPWYVNGSLDPAEHAEVDAHVRDCPTCQADLKLERALGAEIANLPVDMDRGWATLRDRALRQEGALQQGGAPQPPRCASSAWGQSRAFLRRPVAVGWAFAAQAASLILVVGVGAAFTLQTRPVYHTLGDAASSAAVGNVVVIFKPTTPEQALRGALNQIGARLVDGPTVSDAYILRVKASERAKALTRLRSDADVVLAEPIDGDARP
jgi:anti-sigma factor RsiW